MNFLGALDKLLTDNGINYTLDLANDVVNFPFWEGDYQEIDSSYEQGYHEYVFTLTGTNKGTYSRLIKDLDIIRKITMNHTEMLESGHGIAFYYEHMQMIPSQDEQIKRMEITLTIKEWSV